MEGQTFIAFKPDAIQRGLVGAILSRFEEQGLTVQEMKTVTATDELLEEHYSEHVEEDYYDGLVSYMQECPLIVAVLKGEDAVDTVRNVVGETDPAEADSGTIRGDFEVDSFNEADAENRAVRNLIHASATTTEATKEIELWFDS